MNKYIKDTLYYSNYMYTCMNEHFGPKKLIKTSNSHIIGHDAISMLLYSNVSMFWDVHSTKESSIKFSSLNPSPSLDTHGVTGLFLQLRHAPRTLYHLILDLVFVPQNSNYFSSQCYYLWFGLWYCVAAFFSLRIF